MRNPSRKPPEAQGAIIDAARRSFEASFVRAMRAGASREQALGIAALKHVAEHPTPVLSPPSLKPVPSAADREFDAVRAAAEARRETERIADEADAARQERAAAALRAFGVEVKLDTSPAAVAARKAGDEAARMILAARALAAGLATIPKA